MTDEKMEWASIPAKHSYRQSPDSLEKLHALMDEYTASGGFFSTFRPFRRNPCPIHSGHLRVLQHPSQRAHCQPLLRLVHVELASAQEIRSVQYRWDALILSASEAQAAGIGQPTAFLTDRRLRLNLQNSGLRNAPLLGELPQQTLHRLNDHRARTEALRDIADHRRQGMFKRAPVTLLHPQVSRKPKATGAV